MDVKEASEEKPEPIWERQVSTVIDAVEKEQIPRAQYGALLIDEGHDFEADWLKLVTQMIDPDKDSLLLKLNYRNTRQILNFAYKFSKDFLQERKTQEHQADEDSIPMLAPEQAGLEGAEPVVKVWGSLVEEAEFIGHCITTWAGKGMALKDIAVVYTSKAVGEAVTKVLSEAGLDHRYLKNSYQKKPFL